MPIFFFLKIQKNGYFLSITTITIKSINSFWLIVLYLANHMIMISQKQRKNQFMCFADRYFDRLHERNECNYFGLNMCFMMAFFKFTWLWLALRIALQMWSYCYKFIVFIFLKCFDVGYIVNLKLNIWSSRNSLIS